MQKAANCNGRVLVVDDELKVLETVRLMAESDGYVVETASTAREFLLACKSFAPDIMLIDIVMPEIDGIELLRHLSQTGCTSRIVLISGYARGHLDRARELGLGLGLNCAANLTKPLSRSEFRAALTAAPTHSDTAQQVYA